MITVQYREEKCRAISQVFSWVRVQLVLNMWAFLCLCAVWHSESLLTITTGWTWAPVLRQTYQVCVDVHYWQFNEVWISEIVLKFSENSMLILPPLKKTKITSVNFLFNLFTLVSLWPVDHWAWVLEGEGERNKQVCLCSVCVRYGLIYCNKVMKLCHSVGCLVCDLD